MDIELTPEERKTRQLFAEREATANYSEEEILVRQVFVAKYYAAFTQETIENIAMAMNPCFLKRRDLKTALTRLCRAKVLRSRNNRGERLYEVNY